MSKKHYDRSITEYIDELSNDVMKIESIYGRKLNRYWFDDKNNRIILKTKRGKYKIDKPFYDKWNNYYRLNVYDENDEMTNARYDELIYSFSICYYLNIWQRELINSSKSLIYFVIYEVMNSDEINLIT